MRPSSSALALAETSAEQELLEHLAMQTPRLTAMRMSPRLKAAGGPVRVPSLSSFPVAAGSGGAAEAGTLEAAAPSAQAHHADPAITLAATLLKQGVDNLVDDSFNRCFEEREPEPWNWNIYLFPAWVLGLVIRFGVLFPLRALALVLGNLVFYACYIVLEMIPCIPMRTRMAAHLWLIQMLCSAFVMSWSGVIRFHGARPVAKPGKPPGIFVANHSSMIDFVVLQQSHNYAVVGQKHGGWVAFFQDRVLAALDCIWFDRSDSDNKSLVAQRLEEHAHDPARVPILVFPEGTCVNNQYTIMFRKTVFSLDVPINPIAIKYNDIFVPGYWNSRRQGFGAHLFTLMTSWALVCDVWYMDPMTRRAGEKDVDFAKRVQYAIARRAGLKAVDWDGYMKYWSPSDRFIRNRRSQCAEYLLAETRMRVADSPPADRHSRSLSAPDASAGLAPASSVLGSLRATREAASDGVSQRHPASTDAEDCGLSLDE